MERVVDQDEPLVVHLQAGLPGPGRRPRRRHPEDLIQGQFPATGEYQASRRHPVHLVAGEHVHAPFGKHSFELGADETVVGGQDALCFGDQVELQSVSVPAQPAELPGEPVLDREQEFHAAGAGADHADARPAVADAAQHVPPMLDECVDGLDRDHVAHGSGHVTRHGGGSPVLMLSTSKGTGGRPRQRTRLASMSRPVISAW